LKQEWQKVQPWDQANRRQKFGLVWRNRKKVNQMLINAYLYLPFFLLIILWQQGTSHPNLLFVKKKKSWGLFFVVDRQ
jgi:hypothetical protein